MLQSISTRQSRDFGRATENLKNNINNAKKMCPTNDGMAIEQDALPKYSSPLTMLQKIGGMDRKIRVVLKIYSSMYGSYAVVSQDRVIVKDCGYINLKSCTVLTNEEDLTVQIIQRNCEGLTLTFKVPNLEELLKLSKIVQPADEQTPDSQINVDNNKNIKNNEKPKNSKLDKLWKRDLSPRSPCDKRKGSLPALDESEETEESESENEL